MIPAQKPRGLPSLPSLNKGITPRVVGDTEKENLATMAPSSGRNGH